jgi:DNA-binding GntR family transcriptional regulator
MERVESGHGRVELRARRTALDRPVLCIPTVRPDERRNVAQRSTKPLEKTLPLRQLEKALPLRKQVYDALQELITYGALTPGQHLVESELASRLGISRIPVREALQLLQRDGWIDLRPRQGAFVHKPSLREVDEVFTVRTLLEVESTRMATRNVVDKDLRDLRNILGAGHRALLKKDEKELVKLNSAFHGRLTQVAGNRVLSEMIARLDRRIRWYFAPVVRSRGQDSWKEHAGLVDALEARDQERAAEAMRAHADHTRSAYHGGEDGEARPATPG